MTWNAGLSSIYTIKNAYATRSQMTLPDFTMISQVNGNTELRSLNRVDAPEPIADDLWIASMDFLAGCIGGCAGVLVGHPLDTVKVHLQTQDPRNPQFRGTFHCMKTLIARESVRSLYRGMSSPMAGIGAVNAIVFGVYGNVQRMTEDPNSLQSHMLAGSLAGFTQSIVCSPMELAKTRLQLQSEHGDGPKFKGPTACLMDIYRRNGFRALFKGLGITALRDVPGFASYFVSYEYFMRMPPTPHAAYTLLAGGLAGMCSWLACYPIDVVKTCLQADGMSAKQQYAGAVDCMRQNYKSDGIRFFFRGLNSTLIRAFPMNAACFFVVTLVIRMTTGRKVDLVVQSGEPLTMVGIGSTPLCHINHHSHKEEELEKKRFFMVKSLKALGAFDEAVHHNEVEDLAKEFYASGDKYYLFKDERPKTMEQLDC